MFTTPMMVAAMVVNRILSRDTALFTGFVSF